MASLDVLTLEEANEAISTNSTVDDPELAVYVTAVSQLLDTLCGPIVQRTVTEQFDGGRDVIVLGTVPVASVTTVTEYSGTTAQVLAAEAWPTATTFDYYANVGMLGTIARRSNGLGTKFASTRVVVEYVAGRYASTETVEAKFKLAAEIILAEIWRAEQGAGNASFGPVDVDLRPDTFAIPRRARQLLTGEFRPASIA